MIYIYLKKKAEQGVQVGRSILGGEGFNELKHFIKVNSQYLLVDLCLDKYRQVTSVAFELKLFLHTMYIIIQNGAMA